MKSFKFRYIASVSLLLVSVLLILGATVGIGTSENSHFIELTPTVRVIAWLVAAVSAIWLFSTISAHTESIENKNE